MAWDVTVPDTYSDVHVSNTAMETGAAASLAATNKTNKYRLLSETHIFTPVAIETVGTWHHQAVELVQELAGDHNHGRLQRDHLPVPAVISGLAKGKRGLVSEHVHSRLA